jgi:hypothetical protein
LITLYKCFPFCSGVPALPDPPVVPFSGTVNEFSQPDMGTGRNAGVPGALVQIRTTKDTPQLDLTTDGAGNYGGSFQPLADAPTATGSKWGVSGLAGYAGPVTLYTDARTKLMLTPDSATGSNNVALALGGLVNGLPATGSKTVPFGSPTLITIPRNQAGGNSTITLTSVDHPQYTWYGESALALSQSAPTGQVASGSMSVRTIYKYIRINLTVVPPTGIPLPTDLELSCYTWGSVSYAGTPTVGTYNQSGLFGLPTAVTPSGSLAQTNPTARGPASQPLYLSSLARLGTPAAPYQPRFHLHVDSKQMQSDPANGNEDVVLDLGDPTADDARRTGVFNKTIKLILKDVAK